jgi:fumarate hydratase class II
MAIQNLRKTNGAFEVPADKYWGAQTERSETICKIGPSASMQKKCIEGFAYFPKAAIVPIAI